MTLLASEGGYQAFKLGSTEWLWLYFSGATALLALVVGFGLSRSVLAKRATLWSELEKGATSANRCRGRPRWMA